MVTFSKKFAIIHHSFWQLKLCSWKFMNLKMSHLEMIDFEVFIRQLLSLKQVYFSMHFVGSPSKFLARDPISDCFSSRRRRASSLASTDTASLLVVRVRRGVPVHIVLQRARCTYLLFHYYYFSFAAAKYSNDTSFYKWAEKKMDYGEMPSEHF